MLDLAVFFFIFLIKNFMSIITVLFVFSYCINNISKNLPKSEWYTKPIRIAQLLVVREQFNIIC